MQAVKKFKTVWRNSACLLLLNGHFRYRKPSLNELKGVLEKNVLPNFLENAPDSTDQSELLFVRRHDKSGFMVIV